MTVEEKAAASLAAIASEKALARKIKLKFLGRAPSGELWSDLQPPPASSFPQYSAEERSFFHQEVIHTSKKSGARVTRIHTPHGVIDTPSFVAVATNAAFKALDVEDADKAGQQLIFANSYHLMLQPGKERDDERGKQKAKQAVFLMK
jgi:hypothetical protein